MTTTTIEVLVAPATLALDPCELSGSVWLTRGGAGAAGAVAYLWCPD